MSERGAESILKRKWAEEERTLRRNKRKSIFVDSAIREVARQLVRVLFRTKRDR